MKSFLSLGLVLFAGAAFGVSVPGGLIRTAEVHPNDTYELMISPAYVLSPDGAYLSSEMRFQYSEDFSTGFGFGAGEVGFNMGVNGMWHILADGASQPAVSILGGLYLNRVDDYNYFVLKVAPIVSKKFKVDFGSVTPYAGVNITPSFRLRYAANDISMKTSLGGVFAVESMAGLNIWLEAGISLLNSPHDVVVGLSYPFSAI